MCGSRGDISQTPPPTHPHTHTQICANLNIPRTFPLEKKNQDQINVKTHVFNSKISNSITTFVISGCIT